MKVCSTILAILLFNGIIFSQSAIDVYVYLAEKCPISIYMANPLQRVLEEHNEDVNYYAVFPMKNSNNKTATKFLLQHDLDELEIILDPEQIWARTHNATITPEVVVVVNGELKYKGRISNAYNAPGKMKHGRRTNDLLRVLNVLKENPSTNLDWLSAVGCFITFHDG